MAPPSTAHTLYDRPTTQEYGFTSLPADMSKTKPSTGSRPAFNAEEQLKIPQSPLAQRVHAYAKSKLPEQTYNHSLRVYAYGLAAARGCWPEWKVEEGSKLEETW
jgi:cyanamide hydratase